jgi:hypothetical protein
VAVLVDDVPVVDSFGDSLADAEQTDRAEADAGAAVDPLAPVFARDLARVDRRRRRRQDGRSDWP